MEKMNKQTEKTTIVDVRSQMEFMTGNVPGSLNIPLNEIPERVNEFMEMGNVILCCASGNRSGQATAYLSSNGVKCQNGGSWLDIDLKTR